MQQKILNVKTALLVLALVGLSACQQQMQVKPVAASPDIVSLRIAQAADSAQKSLDTIAGIEQNRAPAPPVDDYSNAPPNLSQPVTIKWTGPVDQIARSLATQAGMKFRTTGRPPNVPLTVNLDVYQQPLIAVLHDIGLQVGTRADLAVNGQASVVELRYATIDRM